MVITLKTWNDKNNSVDFSVRNLDKGSWAVYERGDLVDVHQLTEKGGNVHITGSIGPGEEVDFVILNESGARS